MTQNEYFKSRNGKGSGGGHFKKSIIAFAAIVCIAAVTISVYALKDHQSKPVSSSSKTVSAVVSEIKASSSVSVAETPSKPIATTNLVPVLMYHSINFDPKNPNNILRVPTVDFAAEMKWLYDNGYQTLSMDQLYDHISKNEPFPQKSVVITFDDGYKDNYTGAFPIVKQYHFQATVFMITSKIGDVKDGYLSADMLKEMDQNGMRVEDHTVNHLALNTLSYNKQYTELADSKTTLEQLLGRPIYYIAYPFGSYNADSIKAAKQIGYKICFKENGGIAKMGDSQYEFPRFFVGKDLKDFINRVTGKLNLNSSSAS